MCVIRVPEIRQCTKQILDRKSKTEEVGLPQIPCAWCDYKDPIEFDLGNHILENHRQALLKLPIGKGPMDTRINYVIQLAKRKMTLEYCDAGKDLTSKFMQFAEDYLTNKKGDPLHNPTVNSCLVRIPDSINSKCGQVVKIIQRWDGQRPAIQYLLRQFRRWLIDEKIEARNQLNSKMARAHAQTINSKTIWWIEKLLQTPIDDYRKFAVWCILVPYLINIRHISNDETYDTVRSWLDTQALINPNRLAYEGHGRQRV